MYAARTKAETVVLDVETNAKRSLLFSVSFVYVVPCRELQRATIPIEPSNHTCTHAPQTRLREARSLDVGRQLQTGHLELAKQHITSEKHPRPSLKDTARKASTRHIRNQNLNLEPH